MKLSDILLAEDRQTDMERLARMFLAHYQTRCMQYLPEKLQTYKSDLDIHDFPGALLRDVFPNRRGLSKFDPMMQSFIKQSPNLRLGVDYEHKNTKAIYRPGFVKEIILMFEREDFATFLSKLDGNVVYWPLQTLLQTRFHALVHELQHAYDDWASAGKFRENPRSQEAAKAKWDGRSPTEQFALYLNNPIEISARYRETVSSLGARVTADWLDYSRAFQAEFGGWWKLPREDQRRLVKRLAAYWLSQHPQQTRDIGDEVKAFQDKLREKYGRFLYLHYAKGRHAVTIDSFGTDDPQLKRDILNAVIRFANIRRAIVSTSDMKYTPDAKQMGFVNQRSNRHRDYALPLATTMYRPARPALASVQR